MSQNSNIPLTRNKAYDEASVFLPENLLREARRQKNLQNCKIPEICVLDPDGDLVDYLTNEKKATKNKCWACYHSNMYTFLIENKTIGIVPNIVGASYAVLVAEQLFVSGCKLLISVTSAGIINQPSVNKQFALITETIRDEGTSYHYLPKGLDASIDQNLLRTINNREYDNLWFNAKSWTTDAPYRETQSCISEMKKQDVTCVEMEASALYAFAKAKNKDVICFAHLTNTMAQQEGDFEKGEYAGSLATLELIDTVIKKLE